MTARNVRRVDLLIGRGKHFASRVTKAHSKTNLPKNHARSVSRACTAGKQHLVTAKHAQRANMVIRKDKHRASCVLRASGRTI